MADERNIFQAFGFELKRVQGKKSESDKTPSIVPKIDEDGAGYVISPVHTLVSISTWTVVRIKDNQELIKKYRAVAEHPECDVLRSKSIINESIVSSRWSRQSLST